MVGLPRPKTALNDLPEELLSNVASQLTDLKRNTHLANLSLTSRRLRVIAQELLICRPKFNLTYIDRYVWELGHHPHLLPRVHSLEIWRVSEGRIERDEDGLAIRKYNPVLSPYAFSLDLMEFIEECASIAQHFGADARAQSKWVSALTNDVVPALFGVLLCALPNLEELKCGGGWLVDFPFFRLLLGGKPRTVMPSNWKHEYLSGALAHILPKPRNFLPICRPFPGGFQ